MARDRLRTWIPHHSRRARDRNGNPTSLSLDELEKVNDTVAQGLQASTREVYGTGLRFFHEYCDTRDIDEASRAPVNPDIIEGFATSLCGFYAATTINNYIAGIRAWHRIHNLQWDIEERRLHMITIAAAKLAPTNSRKSKRPPFRKDTLEFVCSKLNSADSCDVAIKAALTTTFWGAARLGEILMGNLRGFDPNQHLKRADIRKEARDGAEVTVFHIPRTKCAANGEDIYWARQTGHADPESALQAHLDINNPPNEGPLFCYTHPTETGKRALTRRVFIKRVNVILRDNGKLALQAHSLRIGATLEYLLRGLSFESVKIKGRWNSEAFARYLRCHAQVMAPLMQANPRELETLHSIIANLPAR